MLNPHNRNVSGSFPFMKTVSDCFTLLFQALHWLPHPFPDVCLATPDAQHMHTMPRAPTASWQPHRDLVWWNNTSALCVPPLQGSSLIQLLSRIPTPPHASTQKREQKMSRKLGSVEEGKSSVCGQVRNKDQGEEGWQDWKRKCCSLA